jgi:hypothetical protein
MLGGAIVEVLRFILKVLRDPVWQGIGVIVAVLVLLLGVRVDIAKIRDILKPSVAFLEAILEAIKKYRPSRIAAFFFGIFCALLLIVIVAMLLTPVPPTATPVPPTATPVLPTATPVPPTATPVPLPTATLVLPTATPVPLPTATPVPPTPTPTELPKSGRIAYTEYVGGREPGRYDIYIANVDGSGRYKLLPHASEPAFSPDGRRLAFYSWDEPGIFIINPDGTGRARVSPNPGDSWPTWSRDQSMIAYSSRRITDAIYSTRIRGIDDTKIVNDGEQPSWGPDGRIVYRGCSGATCGLMIVNPADSKPKGIHITTYANDSNPIWSHKMNQIVFTSDRSGSWDIWIINPDGTGLRQLTNSPKSDVTPTWSVDGQWIFFRSDRDDEWAIWAMKPDGSNQVKLFLSSMSEDLEKELKWQRLSAGP